MHTISNSRILCAISDDSTDRVFTTERGYGEDVDSARRLNAEMIDAILKVSAKNAKFCIRKIRITNLHDSQHKMVIFTYKNSKDR